MSSIGICILVYKLVHVKRGINDITSEDKTNFQFDHQL